MACRLSFSLKLPLAVIGVALIGVDFFGVARLAGVALLRVRRFVVLLAGIVAFVSRSLSVADEFDTNVSDVIVAEVTFRCLRLVGAAIFLAALRLAARFLVRFDRRQRAGGLSINE